MTRTEQKYRKALRSIGEAVGAVKEIRDGLPPCRERDALVAAFYKLLAADSRVRDGIGLGGREAALPPRSA